MFFNKIHHLFLGPAVNGAVQLNIIFFCKIFDDFIRTETLMTFLTVHKRIRKASEMAAGHPCLGIHQNSTVNTYVIGIGGDKFLPPCFLYVILKFHTQIAIIPGICQTSVNFRPGVYKASRFGQGHNFFHSLFHIAFLLLVPQILLLKYNIGKRFPIGNYSCFPVRSQRHIGAHIKNISVGPDIDVLTDNRHVLISHVKNILLAYCGSFFFNAVQCHIQIISGAEGFFDSS